jgi:hypothetical protein
MAEMRTLNWIMRLYYEHKASFKRKVLTEKTKKKKKRQTKSNRRIVLRLNPRNLWILDRELRDQELSDQTNANI